jgi:uncharacterized protein (TIGR03086 family)
MTESMLAPLSAALDGGARLVDGVTGAQWDLPTPCTDWTVRQLLNHVVGGNRLFARVFRGEPLPPLSELGRRAAEDQLGDDAAAAYRSSGDDVLDALGSPGVLERTFTVPFGTLPAPALVRLRTVETLVHGWDLARATGQEAPFPDDLAEHELGFSRELLGRIPEGRHPFAPTRSMPDDAPALDRLVALLGRDPSWTGAAGS